MNGKGKETWVIIPAGYMGFNEIRLNFHKYINNTIISQCKKINSEVKSTSLLRNFAVWQIRQIM